MSNQGDNNKPIPIKSIKSMGVKNLAIVNTPSGIAIIGRKFGNEIKQPRMLVEQGKNANGLVNFGLQEVPFIGNNSVIIGEGICFWHLVDNQGLEDLYARSTGQIIIPQVGPIGPILQA